MLHSPHGMDAPGRFSVPFPANLVNKEENIIIQETNQFIAIQISRQDFTRIFNSAFNLLRRNGKWKKTMVQQFSQLQTY